MWRAETNDGLFSVSDVARATGKNYSTILTWIDKLLVPGPDVVYKRRVFYDTERFRKACRACY